MASRTVEVTITSMLGRTAAHGLASTLAWWRIRTWYGRALVGLVRAVHPGLARSLDELARGIENVIGPL